MTFGRAVLSSLAAAFFAIALMVSMVPAFAQDASPTPKIFVVDLQRIMQESAAMQGLREEAQGKRSEMEQQLQEQEQGLRQEDEALSRQRTVLSSEAFEEKRSQLEQKFSQFQSEASTEMSRLDEAYSEAVGEVEYTVVKISDEIASERGANMVIPKSTLLLVHDDFEITDEVLSRLDEQLPSVSMSLE